MEILYTIKDNVKEQHDGDKSLIENINKALQMTEKNT